MTERHSTQATGDPAPAGTGTDPQSRAVTAEPGWFASGDERLFGWLHRPADGPVSGAVVLCQPLFSEYFLTHPTFRVLAERLAGQGLAVLRFDYRGTGDATGRPEEVADVAEWSDDITAAVTVLRDAGAPAVAVVAMRAPALLVPPDVADAVVLWDPPASGRAYVRVWRLFDQVAAETIGRNPREQKPLTSGDVAAATAPVVEGPVDDAPVGFAFPPSFVDSLRARRLAGAVGSTPTLLLTRTGTAPRELTDAGDHLEVGVAAGQEALLEVYPELVARPEATMAAVTAWVTDRLAGRGEAVLSAVVDPELTLPDGAGERPTRLGALEGLGLFAVETLPPGGADGPDALTCVFLTSGLQSHIGPQRLHVDTARRLAGEGIRSLRVDLNGIGDSPTRRRGGDPVFAPEMLHDLDDILGAVTGPVALAGLCSGAYHALEAAARFEVRGVAALHADLDSGPLEYRPETFSSERRVWVYYRAWVKWLKRSRAGRAVVWRIPGPGWWALDRLRLQPDASAGVRRLVAAGTDVVLVMEEWNMATPRAWAVQHAGAHRPTIVASDAEHSLLRAVDRAAMEDLVVELARDWKQGCRARPSSLRLAIP